MHWKKELSLIALFAVLIAVLIVWSALFWKGASHAGATVTIASTTVAVSIADTPAKEAQGLSGVQSLPDNAGMLFVFDKRGHYPFWMKDMLFPLDIIWFDPTGRVVHLEPNLSPATYPQAFGADAYAKYVLEVNAGFAATHGIKEGDTAVFNLGR